MLEELMGSYAAKLKGYPFASAAEAEAEGVLDYVLEEKEEFTALDTPYTMRQTVRREASSAAGPAAWEEEESSEAQSSDAMETPFYDDIVLDIDLFNRGKQIVDNSRVTLVRNEKYGLVGRNGIGKTTVLKAIRKRKFGMPRGVKVHAISQDYVSDERVIDFVGADGGKALAGLGFSKEKQQATLRELSGGWRMRAQLARAIHVSPDLLLLDEPTNFLDITAIAYLQKAVRTMKTVIIVSHDRNFLNATVGRVLHLSEMKIEEFRGNYEAFAIQREARAVALQKAYEQQVAERAHLQSFVDRFRYSASRSAQAQSKLKILERMELLSPPRVDPAIRFSFNATPTDGTLVELENISFRYPVADPAVPAHDILHGLSFKIKHNSRIVVVGENGQGKSTLLKLIAGVHKANSGKADYSSALRVGYFAQHHIDHLEHGEYVLSHLMRTHREDESRRSLAAFGLNATNQLIGTLSGGQKSRMAFALLSLKEPNLLLLDEPTNHLDMETIDALANALKAFQGAVVCISHDLAFIEKVFDTVYICADGKLELFHGTIADYRRHIDA
ncbi:ATP-binding cassette, subfamily F, member 3 [Pancytospora philotis]|nr:ATP-binding cassette, subfamily F, member 3 [Pancytospora philotis]